MAKAKRGTKRKTTPPHVVGAPHVMSDVEDEARAAIEGWVLGARSELGSEPDLPENPEDRRSWRLYNAAQTVKHAPLAISAAEQGDAWGALRHGTWLGLMAGFNQSFPDAYHAHRKLRLDGPDAARGRKASAGQSKKALQKAAKVRTEQHSKIVDAMKEEHLAPRRSFHDAAVRVSRKITKQNGGSYTVRHIERVTKSAGAYWRSTAKVVGPLPGKKPHRKKQ